MKSLLIAWSALLAGVNLWLVGALVVGELRVRRRPLERLLAERYLRILMRHLLQGDALPSFPALGRWGSKRILVQTLAGVVASTYGADEPALREVVAHYQLDRWLLRRVRQSRGYRRAGWLSLLAHLPISPAVAQQALRSARRHPSVRFQGLLLALATTPEEALRHLASYPSPLTAVELAEVVALLRRGLLPLAWEPLLHSSERNLRSLGVELVRQFGIEQVASHLVQIAAGDRDAEVARQALWALCSLHCPLSHHALSGRLRTLSAGERHRLARYMAMEGYSSSLVERLFGAEYRLYYRALITSYKPSLAC